MTLEDLKFLKIAIEKHPTTGITLEYLIKQNAIGALVVNSKGDKTLLVKQYRPGIGGDMYEIPAGLIEAGESALSTLYREIEEETGYLPKDYNIVYTPKKPLTVSPGYTQEKLYIYVIQLKDDSITPKTLKLDEGEDLTGTWFNIDEIEEISQDMKTILALNIFKNLK
ncbi:NUDIX hydrolase [uncultured Fusobacterium sp.]|uniref:NUDIX hydrolase n=1 Tax=uncultured Fusobacterium sp. TaxID=159267 RepID=UPI0025D16051|nr:NUDIX hydrolase [uncultured Fusobacterium sp.]